MELILWRHADAEDPGPAGDFARNLTKKGRKQAQRMAEWLRPRLEGDWRILCSPAARALQTLEPLGREFDLRDAVGPSSYAEAVLRDVGWPTGENTVVVGHNPTLAEVAARLLAGSQGEVAFRKGAVWWFATRMRENRTETVLKAVVDPDMLE